MNILWHSNSPATPSGYGNQTHLFTTRLKHAGHEVAISAFYGREGSALRNEAGILELPRGADVYGNDIIQAHTQYVGAEVVFSLIDPFVLRPEVWRSLPWAAWVPVDSSPVLPQNVAALQAARWVIAMSRFGETELRAAGFQPLYVPHGVETQVYQPEDRSLAREEFARYTGRDVTGKFLVINVAANKGMPSRKNFAGMLEAFARFAQQQPDALFYLHTEPSGLWQGEPILQLAQQYGIADKVILPPQYAILCGLTSPNLMNHLYNAADVFMLLSRGEGFGIPIVEAQSAGCPVIVTDFSASAELCFTGWKVSGIHYTFVPGTRQMIADPAAAAQALASMHAMQQAGHAEALRAVTREAALAYDVDRVFEQYLQPALAQIAAELHPEIKPQHILHQQGQHQTKVRQHTNGISLLVREGAWYNADVDVVHEVQESYFQDVIDYAQVQTAIDIGGHIGSFSLWLKKVSPAARIATVEQDADNAWLARRNLAQFPEVKVYEGRCGYGGDDLVVARHRNNGGGHMILERPATAHLVMEDGSQPEVVEWQGETFSLESLIADSQFERVNVLKLDCEGSELDILRGVSPDTLKRIDVIVGEYHQGRVAFMTAVGDILERYVGPVEFRGHFHPEASTDLGMFMVRRPTAHV